jgi:hypothetical protein
VPSRRAFSCLGAPAIVFALTLQLCRKKNRPYGAHLIFAMHYISFVYLLTIAAGSIGNIRANTEEGAPPVTSMVWRL